MTTTNSSLNHLRTRRDRPVCVPSACWVLANTSEESGRRTSKLSASRKGRSTLSESSAGIRPGLLTGRRYRSRKTDDPSIPPSDLRVAEVNSCSVTLQWAPPISTGGTELTGYIFEKMLYGTDKPWRWLEQSHR